MSYSWPPGIYRFLFSKDFWVLDDFVWYFWQFDFQQLTFNIWSFFISSRPLCFKESSGKGQITQSYSFFRALVEPVEIERDSSDPHDLISVINLTDLAIKRIIRMAKKITPFTTMCQADQIALLKGGCTELMILRSVFNYDPDKNSWRVSFFSWSVSFLVKMHSEILFAILLISHYWTFSSHLENEFAYFYWINFEPILAIFFCSNFKHYSHICFLDILAFVLKKMKKPLKWHTL